MSSSLDIKHEMSAFDRKDRDYYDNFTDEDRKKFSPYLMIRWGSCVSGIPDMQEFYLISINQRLNKHFFTINKHPKLQWLCATAVSPDMGTQRHNWIPPKKKDTKTSSNRKVLESLYPQMKSSDLDLLDSLVTKKEIDALSKEMSPNVK